MTAAVPSYLGKHFAEAPPGHRFGLYYEGWNADFSKPQSGAAATLNELAKIPEHSQKLLIALIERQRRCAASTDHLLSLPYIASSPFATGLGNEHPLENGFSFLNPYGLPYLPGSGVKGVIRRAAEELSSGDWGERFGWSEDTIRLLFGPGEEDATRDDSPLQGALRFWDVLPQTSKNTMTVEIMTPHLGPYYQEKKTPNTSHSPVPIPFLAIPPATRFLFHIECNPARIDPSSLKDWKPLIEAAFNHAGKWLGFGAKTAVGYGRMALDEEAIALQQEQRNKEEKEKRIQKQKSDQEEKLKAMSPLDRSIQEAIDSRPQGQSETKALFNALKANRWSNNEAREVAAKLKARMKNDNLWRERSEKRKLEKDEPYQMTLFVMKSL